MTYLERARLIAGPGGQMCKLKRAMESMTPAVRADVTEAILSDVAAPPLAKLFRDDGYDISKDSIRRHRKGDCQSCIEVFPG